MIQNDTAAKLVALSSRRQEYREFFRSLAERKTNASVTAVDTFFRDPTIKKFGPERHVRAVAVEFLRELERLQLGKFVIGRRGQQSRFVWGAPLREIVTAAGFERLQQTESGSEGVSSRDVPAASDAASLRGAGEMVEHSFWLRSGLKLELRLPLDLSEVEAERIATFVKSLPLRQQS